MGSREGPEVKRNPANLPGSLIPGPFHLRSHPNAPSRRRARKGLGLRLLLCLLRKTRAAAAAHSAFAAARRQTGLGVGVDVVAAGRARPLRGIPYAALLLPLGLAGFIGCLTGGAALFVAPAVGAVVVGVVEGLLQGLDRTVAVAPSHRPARSLVGEQGQGGGEHGHGAVVVAVAVALAFRGWCSRCASGPASVPVTGGRLPRCVPA